MSELWLPGHELPRLRRAMTAERMRWYADVIDTSFANRPEVAAPGIHTDDDIARANGLDGRVADGMISTNWISSMLVDTFGSDYLRGGSLRTRYRRPIAEDVVVETVVVVRGVDDGPDDRRLVLDVSCQAPDGTQLTTGEATVPL